jgi:predicted transcriptional regulator
MATSKTIHVGIGSAKESLDRFEAAWEKAAKGKRIVPSERLTFASLPLLISTLTPARWVLLERLRQEGELTIYELAKKLKRHYKNVHSDVTRLSALGLIEKSVEEKVFVPWDRISAEPRLAA